MGYPSRSAASHLRWQAARGWTCPERLQHPEGVYPSPCAAPAWWCQEEEKEELHHPQRTSTRKRSPSSLCSSTTRSMRMARSPVSVVSAPTTSAAPVCSWPLTTTDSTVASADVPTSTASLPSKLLLIMSSE